jgi:diguanylate cyclase (GGDEF)-like protein
MRAGVQDFVDKAAPARLVAVVERELRNARLSRFDALTQLPNRASLCVAMTRALQAAPASGAKPALLFLELDRFLRFNTSLGYIGGDLLIQRVARRIESTVAPDGYVARLGEDQFAVFLASGRDPLTADAMAMRLQRAFAQPLHLEGEEIYVALSMGIARFPDHGADAMTLTQNAESAMFCAKREGGNRVRVHNANMNHHAAYRLKLENALRGALARNEIEVVYQPIVDLRTGKVMATEALARWHHPELGTIPPDEFIPIAEQTGTIDAIGEWVLRTACRETQAWREAGYADLKVAVNVSGEQFHGSSFGARIPAILRDTGLPASALELEITESVAMKDANSAVSILQSMKRMGIRIAIDDFGMGFSGLSYLRRFPIDILKIDRTFVHEVLGPREDGAILRSIVALGRELGLTVHAEGVESGEQRDSLASLGCDRAQGYDIARPMSAQDVPAFLAAEAC